MPEADAAGCGGAQRHQAGEADPLFRDLADHDALQARRLGIPQQVNRMFPIGIVLGGLVVGDLLAAGQRPDHAEAVDAARKARNPDVAA